MSHSSVDYRKKAIPLALAQRLLRRGQRRLYATFARTFPPQPEWRVLDLGVNGSLARREQHFFEWHYPHRQRIVAAGLESREIFAGCFPEIEYVQIGREKRLPFADGAFDVVFANAVIEHVGSRERQGEFLEEVSRVGRAAFVTTPNRWFPVELHTVLPLVHFLPTPVYRALFRAAGFRFFAAEENLNLLDRRALARLARDLPAAEGSRILRQRTCGWTSNLILTWGSERISGGRL